MLKAHQYKEHHLAVTHDWGGSDTTGLAMAFSNRDHLYMSIDETSEPLTDKEISILKSYQEFEVRCDLKPVYADKVLRDDYPLGPMRNTYIFVKTATGQFRYRQPTWTIGAIFSSEMPLIKLLDHMKKNNREWPQWKKDHSEIF